MGNVRCGCPRGVGLGRSLLRAYGAAAPVGYRRPAGPAVVVCRERRARKPDHRRASVSGRSSFDTAEALRDAVVVLGGAGQGAGGGRPRPRFPARPRERVREEGLPAEQFRVAGRARTSCRGRRRALPGTQRLDDGGDGADPVSRKPSSHLSSKPWSCLPGRPTPRRRRSRRCEAGAVLASPPAAVFHHPGSVGRTMPAAIARRPRTSSSRGRVGDQRRAERRRRQPARREQRAAAAAGGSG